eukprot:1511228-Pyramimonas_sp.AAC.1
MVFHNERDHRRARVAGSLPALGGSGGGTVPPRGPVRQGVLRGRAHDREVDQEWCRDAWRVDHQIHARLRALR